VSVAYWLRGDTRTVLAQLANTGISVDLALCSPPFLEQRSYLPADHPDKAQEMGQEETPGEFLDGQLDVVEGVDQVLAPHGSLVWELGDTMSGSGGAGGDYAEGGMRDGQPRFDGTAAKARRTNGGFPIRDDHPRPARNRQRNTPNGWPADKSLCMIPEAFRWGLAYGRNPHTGRTTTPWRVRNTVVWARTNPPVGRDGDKFRRARSDIAIACRTDEPGRRRYWDGEGVRVDNGEGGTTPLYDWWINDDEGAPLELWVVNSPGYPGAHYATFPPKLVEPLLKAMLPQRVCTVCGEASRRIVQAEPSPYTGGPTERDRQGRGRKVAEARSSERLGMGAIGERHIGERKAITLGWTDCECSRDGSHWRPGIVLDPFAGSGTTLAVATGHGANAIGIDLDGRNIELARQRVGPMFFHEVTVDELADILGVGKTVIGGAA
jgi:hypothetical protein